MDQLQAPGVFPTMITPFTAQGDIDYPALRRLVDWYIECGVQGLFACCLSSEMYDLRPEERLELAQRVHEFAAGRVPVVATGTFGGPVAEQAAFVAQMGQRCDAVVVVTSQLAPQEADDEAFRAAAAELLAATTCQLGLYECPLPYKRLLSPETLAWAAGTGRFFFHKDTCCSMEQIRAKLAAPGGPPRFFNANVATLHASLQAGGHGFSGISANMYPFLHAFLCANFESNPDAARRVQCLLSVGENVVTDRYPASAKRYLGLNEACRCLADAEFDEEQRLKLDHLKMMVQDLCEQLGIRFVPFRGE